MEQRRNDDFSSPPFQIIQERLLGLQTHSNGIFFNGISIQRSDIPCGCSCSGYQLQLLHEQKTITSRQEQTEGPFKTNKSHIEFVVYFFILSHNIKQWSIYSRCLTEVNSHL